MTLKQARRELREAGVPPHLTKLALYRLRALNAFWKSAASKGGRDLTRTRAHVADQLRAKYPGVPIGKTSLYNWESMFRIRGIVGLTAVSGRQSRRLGELHRNAMDGMPIGQLADYCVRVVGVLASRAKRL